MMYSLHGLTGLGTSICVLFYWVEASIHISSSIDLKIVKLGPGMKILAVVLFLVLLAVDQYVAYIGIYEPLPDSSAIIPSGMYLVLFTLTGLFAGYVAKKLSKVRQKIMSSRGGMDTSAIMSGGMSSANAGEITAGKRSAGIDRTNTTTVGTAASSSPSPVKGAMAGGGDKDMANGRGVASPSASLALHAGLHGSKKSSLLIENDSKQLAGKKTSLLARIHGKLSQSLKYFSLLVLCILLQIGLLAALVLDVPYMSSPLNGLVLVSNFIVSQAIAFCDLKLLELAIQKLGCD
jgi:hypothetical protein